MDETKKEIPPTSPIQSVPSAPPNPSAPSPLSKISPAPLTPPTPATPPKPPIPTAPPAKPAADVAKPVNLSKPQAPETKKENPSASSDSPILSAAKEPPKVVNDPQSPFFNKPLKAHKTPMLPWIVSAVLLVGILALGFFAWQMQKENKSLTAAKAALEQEKGTAVTKSSGLEASQMDLQKKLEAATEQISTLTAEKKVLADKVALACTKENSCKFRAPGAEFRCDAQLKYSDTGASVCSCSADCEAVKK